MSLSRQARRRLERGQSKIENHKDGKGVSLILTAEEHQEKINQAANKVAAYFREAYPNTHTQQMALLISKMMMPPPPQTLEHLAFMEAIEAAGAVVMAEFGLKKAT